MLGHGDDLMSLGIKSSAFLKVFTMGSWIHDEFLDSRWVLGFLEPLRQRFQNFGPTGIHNWFQQVLCTMVGDRGKEQKAHAQLTLWIPKYGSNFSEKQAGLSSVVRRVVGLPNTWGHFSEKQHTI